MEAVLHMVVFQIPVWDAFEGLRPFAFFLYLNAFSLKIIFLCTLKWNIR